MLPINLRKFSPLKFWVHGLSSGNRQIKFWNGVKLQKLRETDTITWMFCFKFETFKKKNSKISRTSALKTDKNSLDLMKSKLARLIFSNLQNTFLSYFVCLPLSSS